MSEARQTLIVLILVCSSWTISWFFYGSCSNSRIWSPLVLNFKLILSSLTSQYCYLDICMSITLLWDDTRNIICMVDFCKKYMSQMNHNIVNWRWQTTIAEFSHWLTEQSSTPMWPSIISCFTTTTQNLMQCATNIFFCIPSHLSKRKAI